MVLLDPIPAISASWIELYRGKPLPNRISSCSGCFGSPKLGSTYIYERSVSESARRAADDQIWSARPVI
jgi:hypothetical protein